MRTPSLITSFLAMIRRRTGASSATMLVHMEPPERQSLMLVSDGEASPISELADEAAAWRLISSRSTARGPGEHLAVVPCGTDGATLLRIAFSTILERPSGHRRTINERRSEPDIVTAPMTDGALWLGLTDCPESRVIDALSPLDPNADDLPDPDDESGWLNAFISLAAKFAWSTYHLTGSLQDPVSQLGGRMEFQVFLKRAIAAARRHRQSVGLLLVNPDDFTMINHRYGRERGDLAIREIADQLIACLRKTDGVFRYGGAVFGAVLPATDVEQCRAAAEKVRRMLSEHRYVDDSEQLTFSIGATVAGPEHLTEALQATDLLKGADIALNRAKLTGGSRALVTEYGNLEQAGLGLAP